MSGNADIGDDGSAAEGGRIRPTIFFIGGETFRAAAVAAG